MNRAVLATIALASAPALADDLPPYPAPPPLPPQPPPTSVPPPAPYYAYPPPAPAPSLDGPKSSGTAVLFSVGATLGPGLILSAALGDDEDRNGDLVITVLLASALVGPSAGHIYAGNFFTLGLGIRAAGLTSILIGASFGGDDGIGLIVLGSIAAVSGAIADFAGLGRAVSDYNFEYHRRRIVPTVAPVVDAGGSMRPVAGLAGTF